MPIRYPVSLRYISLWRRILKLPLSLSPTVGAFTAKTTSARRYSTWKIHIKGIQLFFGDKHQHWNVNYRAAQAIFSGPLSLTVKTPIIAGHRLLYARTTANRTGILSDAEGFWSLFRARVDGWHGQGLARLVGVTPGVQTHCPVCGRPESDIHNLECTATHHPGGISPEPGAPTNTSTGGRVSSDAEFGGVISLASPVTPHDHIQRIKPAVYTYIIDEETFRFSETGAAFFVDFASKHALHSSCAETVRYAGGEYLRSFGNKKYLGCAQNSTLAPVAGGQTSMMTFLTTRSNGSCGSTTEVGPMHQPQIYWTIFAVCWSIIGQV